MCIASSVDKAMLKFSYISLLTFMCYTHMANNWDNSSTVASLLLLVNSAIFNIPKMQVSFAFFPYKSVIFVHIPAYVVINCIAQRHYWLHSCSVDPLYFKTSLKFHRKASVASLASQRAQQTFSEAWTTVFSRRRPDFCLTFSFSCVKLAQLTAYVLSWPLVPQN